MKKVVVRYFLFFLSFFLISFSFLGIFLFRSSLEWSSVFFYLCCFQLFFVACSFFFSYAIFSTFNFSKLECKSNISPEIVPIPSISFGVFSKKIIESSREEGYRLKMKSIIEKGSRLNPTQRALVWEVSSYVESLRSVGETNCLQKELWIISKIILNSDRNLFKVEWRKKKKKSEVPE